MINMSIRIERNGAKDPITGKIIYDEAGRLEAIRKFEKILNDDAEDEVRKIIDQVNEKAIKQTPEEKLKILFKILTGSEYIYDTNFTPIPHTALVSRRNYDENYKYKDFHITVPQADWRCLLLVKKGVCIEFALTFENLCVRLGIPCIKVDGMTTLGHAWNAVLINGEVRFIDTSFTKIDRMVREGKEPVEKYFLKDYETFKQWGINCDDSLHIIKKRLVKLQQSMFGMKSDKISGIKFLNEDDIKKYGSNATGDDDIKKRRR